MKTQLLEQSLKEIQEEDQLALDEKKKKLAETKIEIDRKTKDLEKAKSKEEKYQILTSMDKNILKYIHAMLPLVEVPAAVMIALSLSSLTFSLAIVMVIVILGLIDDILFVYSKYYEKIGLSESVFKNIVDSMKEIAKSKKSHRRGLNRSLIEQSLIRDELVNLQGILEILTNEIDTLREEISFVEGSSYSLEIMNDKYGISEVPDDNEISNYLDERKTLTRHI